MSQYFIEKVNLNNIEEFSDKLIKELNFRKITSECMSSFRRKFNPCAWKYGDVVVMIYNEKYDISIETEHKGDIIIEPEKGLIGKIMDCANVTEIIEGAKIYGRSMFNNNI